MSDGEWWIYSHVQRFLNSCHLSQNPKIITAVLSKLCNFTSFMLVSLSPKWSSYRIVSLRSWRFVRRQKRSKNKIRTKNLNFLFSPTWRPRPTWRPKLTRLPAMQATHCLKSRTPQLTKICGNTSETMVQTKPAGSHFVSFRLLRATNHPAGEQ